MYRVGDRLKFVKAWKYIPEKYVALLNTYGTILKIDGDSAAIKMDNIDNNWVFYISEINGYFSKVGEQLLLFDM